MYKYLDYIGLSDISYRLNTEEDYHTLGISQNIIMYISHKMFVLNWARLSCNAKRYVSIPVVATYDTPNSITWDKE